MANLGKIKISELPDAGGTLDGLYTIVSKTIASGAVQSFKVNLGAMGQKLENFAVLEYDYYLDGDSVTQTAAQKAKNAAVYADIRAGKAKQVALYLIDTHMESNVILPVTAISQDLAHPYLIASGTVEGLVVTISVQVNDDDTIEGESAVEDYYTKDESRNMFATNEKLTDLERKTNNISADETESEVDEIVIEDNDGNEVVNISPNGVDCKNLKSNGKDVATQEDIEGKQDIIPQVSQEETTDGTDEIKYASDDYDGESVGEVYASIGRYGVKSKAFINNKGENLAEITSAANNASLLLLRKHIMDDAAYFLNYGLSSPDPSDYNNGAYLEGKIKNIDANGNNFIFITDTHWETNRKHSTVLAEYIKSAKRISKVCFGGDAVNDGHNCYGAANELSAYVDEYFAAFGSDAIYVQGNHDSNYVTFNLAHADNPAVDYHDYLVSDKEVYKRTVGKMSEKINYDTDGIARLAQIGLVGEELEEATAWFKMHYYFDDTINKNRYIILETGDSGIAMYGLFNLSYTGSIILQLPWLANVLKTTPEGYNVIVLGHMVGNNSRNLDDSENKSLMQILHLFKSRTSGKVALWCHSKTDGEYRSPLSVAFIGPNESDYYRTFDFSDVNKCGKLLVVAGHYHQDKAFVVQSSNQIEDMYKTEYTNDMVIEDDGVLVVWSSTDSIGNKGAYSPSMEWGTITEQCFDVISIKDREIRFTRIGAGDDRIFKF